MQCDPLDHLGAKQIVFDVIAPIWLLGSHERFANIMQQGRPPKINLAGRSIDNAKGMESLEQMKHEDIELNRQLHNICRGC